MNFGRICLTTLLLAFPYLLQAQTQAPIVENTNITIRVVAANLSSGNNQRYESPGLNILKALKPDVVAIQEFNYSSTNGLGINTTNALREMVDRAFGTNFVYVREAGKSIPNGVISRFPILASGIWDDVQVSDREFIWCKLDIPGTNELYVVSVHLHSGGGPTSRQTEATNLRTLMQSNFPTNALVVLAGDMNIDSTGEAALTTFKTFLSDSPIPTDAVSGGDPDTNMNRNERYDYVFLSFSLASNRVATVIGSRSFTNGLVFDSRVYTPLSDVAPVQAGDSGVTGMQHMAVVKDFRINYLVTNYVTVIAPRLTLNSTNVLRWIGQTNVAYRVQTSPNFTNWEAIGTAQSASTNFAYTNSAPAQERLFYRLIYP